MKLMMVDGKPVWYTGNKTVMELIEEGEIIAFNDGGELVLKRTARATDAEKKRAIPASRLRRALDNQ